MMGPLFENFVRKATDWWFRARSIERFLITAAFGLLIAIFGGPPLIEIVLRVVFNVVPSEYQSAIQTLDSVDHWIIAICLIVILVALALAIARFREEASSRSKKKVVVLEGRGLRDDDGSPLVDIISDDLPGQRIAVLLDLRNRMDGKVIAPERALDDIAAAHRSLLQHQKNVSRNDLTTVYGGLTSVPYTFLTGVLLDDEGAIVTYDWDRNQECWREISGEDDHALFQVTGLRSVTSTDEIVLSLSFSYPVDDADLATTFSCSVVHVTLDGMSSDAHWSAQKQSRLSLQFLEIIKQLSGQGIKRIHLVMAAPNSVVFNFGRRYDKRNLPEIVVYQYERGSSPAYPWGVVMPVCGIELPLIIYTSKNIQDTKENNNENS